MHSLVILPVLAIFNLALAQVHSADFSSNSLSHIGDQSSIYKRMLTADSPVNVPLPGTVSAASGSPLSTRDLLVPGSTTLNGDSQILSPRNDLDSPVPLPVALPALPIDPPLLLSRDISVNFNSARDRVTTERQTNLPVSVSLPDTPVPANDPVSTPTVDSSVSLPVPRDNDPDSTLSLVVRKEERL